MLQVVKPTIPIMVDQCRSITEKSISVAYVNNEQEGEWVKGDVVAGKYEARKGCSKTKKIHTIPTQQLPFTICHR